MFLLFVLLLGIHIKFHQNMAECAVTYINVCIFSIIICWVNKRSTTARVKKTQTVTTHLFNDPDNDCFSPEREAVSLSDTLDRARTSFCCSASVPIVFSNCCLISSNSAIKTFSRNYNTVICIPSHQITICLYSQFQRFL